MLGQQLNCCPNIEVTVNTPESGHKPPTDYIDFTEKTVKRAGEGAVKWRPVNLLKIAQPVIRNEKRSNNYVSAQ
jgi:hypothetical protein